MLPPLNVIKHEVLVLYVYALSVRTESLNFDKPTYEGLPLTTYMIESSGHVSDCDCFAPKQTKANHDKMKNFLIIDRWWSGGGGGGGGRV